MQSNNEQLLACRQLVLAFHATEDARAQLQQRLHEEQALLQKLQDPLQPSLVKSRLAITATSECLKESIPAREKRHS